MVEVRFVGTVEEGVPQFTPTTNRFSRLRTFTSHLPLEGMLIGAEGVKRGARNRTLTKRIASGRIGSFENHPATPV
jgi:hypothetical protein